MATINSTCYLDLTNGNDTPLTAISGVDFVNNGSNKVLGYKVSHGLEEGQIIVIPTGTYAGNHIVSIIDSDNFLLSSGYNEFLIGIGDEAKDGDTITIASETYTFRNSPSLPFDVQISIDQIGTFVDNVNMHSSLFFAVINQLKILLYPLISINDYDGNDTPFSTSREDLIYLYHTYSDKRVNFTTARLSTTITPIRGSSWANAFKTFEGANTAAYHSYLRIAKNDTEFSLGVNGTFTSGSNVLELSSALSQEIVKGNEAASEWVCSTNITSANSSSGGKAYSYYIYLTSSANFTTGKMAYKTLPSTLNLSAFSKISMWLKVISSPISGGNIVLNLCSDTIGETVVNTIVIPDTLAINTWNAIAIDYGSPLGSNINSISFYANSDPLNARIYFQNVIATNILYHKTRLISPITKQKFMPLCINETSIILDGGGTTTYSTAYFYGETETGVLKSENSYLFPHNLASANFVYLIPSVNFLYGVLGGYNTSTNKPDGKTNLTGSSGLGALMLSRGYVSNLCVSRFYVFLYGTGKESLHNIFAFSLGLNVVNNNSGNPSWFNMHSCFCLNIYSEVYKTGNLVSYPMLFNTTLIYSAIVFTTRTTDGFIVGCKLIKSNVSHLGYETLTILNTEIIDGQVSANSSRLIVKNSSFSNSVARTRSISIQYNSDAIFYNCSFSNSELYYYYAKVLFDSCVFDNVNNHSQCYGDVAYRNHNNNPLLNSRSSPKYILEYQTLIKREGEEGSWAVNVRETQPYIGKVMAAKRTEFDALILAELFVESGVPATLSAWFYRPLGSYGAFGLELVASTMIGVDRKVSFAPTQTLEWFEVTLSFIPLYSGIATIKLYAENIYDQWPIYLSKIS